MLKRCVAPHRTSYASEALDRAGRSLETALLVPSCDHAHQTAHRRVPEADAESQRYQADRERRHGMNGGGGGESDRRADEADSERRLVAEMPYDWPNHPALNHRAKQPEAGKKIAGPRRVEAEPPRSKQGERGLEYREGEPVQEIDGEHAADDRAAQQPGEVAKWIAGPGVGAV